MRRWIGWAASIIVALVFLAPLVWMVLASLRPDDQVFRGGFLGVLSIFSDGEVTVSNYVDAWRAGGLAWGLLNSAIQVTGIIGLGLIVNSMAAYAFARMRFAGRDALFAAVVVLIILPVQVLAVPLWSTVRQLWSTATYGGAMTVLILPFAAKAFNIYFLRAHFLSLPRELEEAAIVDGAGPWQVFWRVALPSVKPALATIIVIDMFLHWGDFIWPLVVSSSRQTRTIQISLASLFSAHTDAWGDIMACAVIATAPVVLVFTFFQRYVVSGHLGAGIK